MTEKICGKNYALTIVAICLVNGLYFADAPVDFYFSTWFPLLIVPSWMGFIAVLSEQLIKDKDIG